MMRSVVICLCAVLIVWLGARPTYSFGQIVEKDSVGGTMLLTDIDAQMASTEMLNSIYGYDFEKMEEHYAHLLDQYGWHSMPYFLRGLGEWWKIEPDIENKSYDEVFYAYMDSSIVISKSLYKIERLRIEAAFFLSAAHAFKGRLLAERKHWRKATVQAKLALKYMEECHEQADMSQELLFGEGLYNYFAEWIPENYGILKPVMLFFRDGDKEKGITQLREVANNAFYTRTEAQFFLVRVLNLEGKNRDEVIRLTAYLHKLYPENPVFHRYYARSLYSSGFHDEMKFVCEGILAKIDSSAFGYGPNAGRYASFFLGQYHDTRSQTEQAKKYFGRVLEFVEQNGYYESGYHLYSLLSLEEIAARENDRAAVTRYFKMIKKHAKKKQNVYKRAKEVYKKVKQKRV